MKRSVAALALLVFLAGCVQQPATVATVYPGSQQTGVQPFVTQIIGINTQRVSVAAYAVDAQPAEIIEWYKNNLAGYELVEEIPLTTVSTPQGTASWAGAIFKKGNEGFGVWAISFGEGQTIYYIGQGPLEEMGIETTSPSQLPSADQASGQEPVARYPGSVMLSYSVEQGYPAIGTSLDIEYGTNDDALTVASWYKQEMQTQGWELANENQAEDSIYLEFTKNSERLYVTIYRKGTLEDYTLIMVSYEPNRLPASDVVSGQEPVTRYPGSIMLNHVVTTVAGVTAYQIEYGTHDSLQQVLDWYLQNLPNEGWEIVNQEQTGNIANINAMKQGAVLNINIEVNAYTKITVSYTSGL